MGKFEKKQTFKMDFKKMKQELGYKPNKINKIGVDTNETKSEPKILYSGRGQGTLQ